MPVLVYTAAGSGLFAHAVHTPGLVAPSICVQRIHPARYCPTGHDVASGRQGLHPCPFRRYVPRAHVQLAIEALPCGDHGHAEGHAVGRCSAAGQ